MELHQGQLSEGLAVAESTLPSVAEVKRVRAERDRARLQAISFKGQPEEWWRRGVGALPIEEVQRILEGITPMSSSRGFPLVRFQWFQLLGIIAATL